MLIRMIEGATRVCGEEQGYLALPVRDVILIDSRTNHAVPVMITAWEPTPAELDALNKGAPVYVQIYGDIPPPMLIDVGPIPE